MRSLKLLIACLCTSFVAVASLPAKAQLNPDKTLGAESSVVTPNLDSDGNPFDLIEGGATRGSNLFHSFSDFNIDSAEQVYFSSPAGIETILSRVTGSSLSNINGLLGTTGDSSAALILMNPNGIVFGEGAELDTKGAFTATTATSVQFGQLGSFSAVNTNEDNLLSVQPSAFFFSYLQDTGNISILNDGGETTRLQVPNGTSLTLLGKNILMDGGQLDAWEGRVRLGAVSGEVFIDTENDSLSIPRQSQQGNIQLQNGARIDVRLATDGDIQLSASDINILSDSVLVAGIEPDFGQEGSQAGDISLTATGSITLDDVEIVNAVGRDAVGNAGNIQIDGKEVEITGEALVNSSTFGKGNAGDIFIKAQESALFNGESDESLQPLAASSIVSSSAQGEGGNIEILADTVSFTNGVSVSTSTFGTGDAGNLSIRANDSITFGDLNREDDLGGNAFSDVVGETAVGQAGNIELSANSISLNSGSQVISSTSGIGDAGNILIRAKKSVSLDGRSPNNQFGSGAFSGVSGMEGRGQGGNISVIADSVTVTRGAQLSASTSGTGDAGRISISAQDRVLFSGRGAAEGFGSNASSSVLSDGTGQAGGIDITAHSLSVEGGALLSSSTFGMGNAGNINLDIEDSVVFDGGITSKDASLLTAVSSTVLGDGKGNGGNVSISAKTVSFLNGALASLRTFGTGDAGSLLIEAEGSVEFSGRSGTLPDSFRSGVFSSVTQNAIGDGGNIEIFSDSLSVREGAQLTANTAGMGNAGNIIIRVRGATEFSGREELLDVVSGAFSSVDRGGIGEGGTITVVTDSLTVKEGAQLGSSTFGTGDAGNIILKVRNDTVFDGRGRSGISGSGAFSTVSPDGVGQGGNIDLSTSSLFITGLAQLGTSTFGAGDAGNITVSAEKAVTFDGLGLNELFGNGAFSTVASTGEGSGGDIYVTTDFLTLTNGATLNARSEGNGDAGSIAVEGTSSVILSGASPDTGLPSNFLTVTSPGSGSGGDIQVTAPRIELSEGATISAETNSAGRSGDIYINARDINIASGGQVAASSNGTGAAGNIMIDASGKIVVSGSDPTFSSRIQQQPFLLRSMTPESRISTQSLAEGAAGNLSISGSQLEIDGASLTAESAAVDGGNINLELSGSLILRNNSQITATAGTSRAGGNGGNISIAAPIVVAIPEENSDITANAFVGRGGRVNLESLAIFGLLEQDTLTNMSDIVASSEQGIDGIIVIDVSDTGLVENNLAELSQNLLNSEELVTGSCVVQKEEDTGTFTLSKADQLISPLTSILTVYSTSTIQDVPTESTSFQEPEELYQLADGRIVMSHRCE